MTSQARKPKNDVTAEFVRSVLDYDEDSGEFRWRNRPDMAREWNTMYAGKIAGTVGKLGYRQITINYRRYLAHRLAWLVMTGAWPESEIDHRDDKQRANNRMTNLREASHSQNAHNRRKYRNNTSGYKGVCWDKSRNKWVVMIQVAGKQRQLGRFSDREKAKEAYDEAARLMHGEFARSNS